MKIHISREASQTEGDDDIKVSELRAKIAAELRAALHHAFPAERLANAQRMREKPVRRSVRIVRAKRK